MNVNLFCIRPPDPSGKGDQVIYHQRCQQFSTLSSVDVVNVFCLSKEIIEYIPPSKKVRCHFVKTNLFIRVLMAIYLLVFKRAPIQSSIFFSLEMAKIARKLDENSVCLIGSLRLNYILDFAKCRFKILDMIDVMSKSYKQFARNERQFYKRLIYSFEANRLRHAEYQITRANKLNFLVSSDDATAQHLCAENIQVIPIMVKGIKNRSTRETADRTKCFVIGFHGNLEYAPNAEACSFIIKEIAPRLYSSDINIIITGRNPRSELISEILMLEPVAKLIRNPSDIFSVIDQFDVYLAPIFMGAGMQNKLLEAAELGIPIITTEKAAKPLGFKHGEHCLIAETADGFYEAVNILRNSGDLRKLLAANAKRVISDNHSAGKISKKIEKLILV